MIKKENKEGIISGQLCMEFPFFKENIGGFLQKSHLISFKYQLYTKHYLMAEETEPRT